MKMKELIENYNKASAEFETIGRELESVTARYDEAKREYHQAIEAFNLAAPRGAIVTHEGRAYAASGRGSISSWDIVDSDAEVKKPALPTNQVTSAA